MNHLPPKYPGSPVFRREWDWVIDRPTARRFEEIALRILDLDPNDPEVACLEEEVRRLPGFPVEAQSWDAINLVRKPTAAVAVPRN